MSKISIILASNYELWWEGLLLLIKGRAQDIDTLTISYNAVDTIEKAKQLNPDIILLDEEIEGGDCGEVAQRINELNPDIKIIIVIKPYKDVSLSTSFKARAKAYIDKDITYPELESCIRYVAKGGVVVISPLVARKLLEQVSQYGNKMSSRAEYDVGLSKREKEVLALLTKRGITNREIANTLSISENTVKVHLSRVMEKMQVRNRQQAAIMAREKGVIPEAVDQAV
jgi:DNA-binding NarL/FixJ family response regulator